MGTELRDRLQATLGQAYTLERELGGGGMSRVFVAEEHALGRRVVVKVLPPELAAGVSVERFKREIAFAAQLQHPHILPVLSAGETDGLPYYTMPLVEGDSLRARLARGESLPIPEIVHILGDVAKALAHAHARGVVHRDIKPDNVLLSGGAAVVTDFGVAKALSSAMAPHVRDAHQTMLTGAGMTTGTPAYMAPEQAAADPAADHRVDIYAFGVMAYELLCGRPPFTGRTMQALLAAHLSEPPPPLDGARPDVPFALTSLIMACLEKEPAHRPQTAREIVERLEGVSVASDAGGPAWFGGPLSPVRALTVTVIGAGAVMLLAKAAEVALGLPEWVFAGTLVVLALGIAPVLLALLLRGRGSKTPATTSGLYPYSTISGGGHRTRWLTPARATRVGVVLVLAWAAIVGGTVTLGALGLGPARSLLAAGVLEDRGRLLLADFAVAGGDTLLGAVVTEAIRTDLTQSPVVTVVPASAVRSGLARMQRPPGTRLDAQLAHDLAVRDGIPAFVTGEVVRLGGGFVLTARLVSAETGDELALVRETASSEAELLGAIDGLSKQLRARIGESMREVRRAPALAQVTTGSLDALQKYAQAVRLIDGEGEYERGIPLLEEAIALDSTFAMAYRKLAISLTNTDRQFERANALLTKAYEHRSRLTPLERYVTEGSYYGSGAAADPEKAIAAYEAALAIDPGNSVVLNNLAGQYSARGDRARAEALYKRAIAAEPDGASAYFNLIGTQVGLGKLDSAEATFARARAQFPRHRLVHQQPPLLAYFRHGPDSAEAAALRTLAIRDLPPEVRANALTFLTNIELLRGRFDSSEAYSRQLRALNRERGEPDAALAEQVSLAFVDLWYRDDPQRALTRMERASRLNPIESYPILLRPYLQMAIVYAAAGRPEQARAALASYDSAMALDSTFRRIQAQGHLRARAELALAEQRPLEAIRLLDEIEYPGCPDCGRPELGRAYDQAGMQDSTIAMFESYLADRFSAARIQLDALYLPYIYKRLGELYETRGDTARAREMYGRFVEMWKDGDPAARERVAEIQRRLTRLGAAA